MKVSTSGLMQDSPARPLLLALVSYQGITDAAGAATGLTLVDGDLVNEPSYDGQLCKIRSGAAAGQVKPIYVQAGNTLTFATPWTDAAGAVVQIAAGTLYDILSISGGGGGPTPAPKEGLSYYGIVDAVPGANQFTIGSLAGLGAGKFDGATNPYYAFVLRDFGGVGAAPQGELQPITAYATATGDFTTAAFAAAVAVGDEILILHPAIAASLILSNVTIIAEGTLDTSSATVPADSTRTEGNDYFKGCILMPKTGAAALQPRPIRQFTAGTGVFTLDEPFTAAPGLVGYWVLASDYPVQRLLDIFNLVNAMLTTTETGGTITTTGALQDVYINNAPAGVFEPLCVKLDLSNMGVAHVLVVSTYYRIAPAPAALTLQDQVTYNGAQTLAIKNISLDPNRYGLAVRLQLTAGANIDIPWEAIYRS